MSGSDTVRVVRNLSVWKGYCPVFKNTVRLGSNTVQDSEILSDLARILFRFRKYYPDSETAIRHQAVRFESWTKKRPGRFLAQAQTIKGKKV
ncbi:hypothetical protein [Siminovitchia acidinfaciens]|uniref:hypothetical protein n=1 Tax=Siminovitchia acidinfaciens TaxID=2321395 RepID=UPI0013E09834|nr:hypothetical protein [Siminovitchia acidinfaciens]